MPGTIEPISAPRPSARAPLIVPGKAADVICVDLSGVEHQPLLDPLSELVYAASRHDVTDVWIAGEQLVAERTALRLDVAGICAAAERWGRQLRA